MLFTYLLFPSLPPDEEKEHGRPQCTTLKQFLVSPIDSSQHLGHHPYSLLFLGTGSNPLAIYKYDVKVLPFVQELCQLLQVVKYV